MVGSGHFCSVALCNNSRRKSNIHGTGLSFFTFPKDSTLQKEWILRCRRADYINPLNARVCSIHFPAEDFQRNLKAELMGCSSRKLLKETAVPSLNLPHTEELTTTYVGKMHSAQVKVEKMPSGNSCSVAICSSQSTKAKHVGKLVKFFRFPKDPNIRKEWVIKCFRKDRVNPENGRICNKHFMIDDYDDALQAKLLNIQPRILKKTAIPSLKISVRDYQPSISESCTSSANSQATRKIRSNAKKRKAFVAPISLENENRQDVAVYTNDIKSGSQSESEGSISPIKFKTVYRHTIYKRSTSIDVNLLKQLINAMEKLNDECYLFGEFISHEMRSIRSPSLRMKLKTQVQNEILKFTENFNKNKNG